MWFRSRQFNCICTEQHHNSNCLCGLNSLYNTTPSDLWPSVRLRTNHPKPCKGEKIPGRTMERGILSSPWDGQTSNCVECTDNEGSEVKEEFWKSFWKSNSDVTATPDWMDKTSGWVELRDVAILGSTSVKINTQDRYSVHGTKKKTSYVRANVDLPSCHFISWM